MGKHGKQGSLDRWQKRFLIGQNVAIQRLAKEIKILPLKTGQIAIMLGDEKNGNIQFVIDTKIVLDAAEAGVKFAEELQNHSKNGAGATEIVERVKEASTQPIGG